MRILLSLFLFSFSLILCSQAHAELWRLNPNHSQIRFSVPFMGVSTVEGAIERFRINMTELKITPEHAGFESAELVMLVSGLSTGVAQRDRHLKGPDFFYARLHPRFIVRARKVALSLDTPQPIKASFTIKDVTKEVPLELTYLGTKANKEGLRSAFFAVKSTLSRADFGLGWNQYLTQNELLLGDKIQVSAHFEFNPVNEKPSMGQFYKLTKEERSRFLKMIPNDSEFEGSSSKDVLILESKVDTLTQEAEALSRSNEVLRSELDKVRQNDSVQTKRGLPLSVTYASILVFAITLLFGFGLGVLIKWKLLKPLVMENPQYKKLDRLTDLLLMALILSGVGVMSWFFGAF